MRLKSHALIATFVAAALAAPPAPAMPIDPPIHQRVTEARTHSGQLPGPPTWPMNPQPLDAVDTKPPADDQFPWDAIVFAIAGAGLALAVGRVLIGARRHPHVPA